MLPGSYQVSATVSGGNGTVSCVPSTVPKGDSIHYRADVPHSLRNAGKAAAEAFLIVRYREAPV